MYRTFHPCFLRIFFFSFIEKNPPIKFHGVFDNFSWTYEVAKFWMLNCISTYVMPYTPLNKQNIIIVGYMETFGVLLLMSFCFMMKKDHFKQKLLLWRHVPFKGFNLFRLSVPSPNYSASRLNYFLQLKIRKIIFRQPPIIKIAFSWPWWKGRNWMRFVCSCTIKSPELSNILKNYK